MKVRSKSAPVMVVIAVPKKAGKMAMSRDKEMDMACKKKGKKPPKK